MDWYKIKLRPIFFFQFKRQAANLGEILRVIFDVKYADDHIWPIF
jgi:hypothetical protein